MHDAIFCERVGTPAVGVMTAKFVSAAELMARVLGMPNYQFAVIDHPVSSASDAELEARAQVTLEAIQALVVQRQKVQRQKVQRKRAQRQEVPR